MKCPVCGGAELVSDTRDMDHTYRGEKTSIPSVCGDYCPACGEVLLDSDEATRVSVVMAEFRKQVNASIVDPKFIMSVRKKLNLDQKKASEIFGGGINAFSRYETGKIKPPLALIKLFRILDAHPELLPLAMESENHA